MKNLEDSNGEQSERPGKLRPSADTFLTVLAQCTPLLAQTALLWYMIVQGRWVFLALLLPGLAGNLALCILTLLRSQSTAKHRQGQRYSPGSQTHDVLELESTCADMTALASLDLPCLESKLFDNNPRPTGKGQHWQSIVHTWLSSLEGATSYQAMIGCGTREDFLIDLAADGPHALVAGTTGSGKSVFLQTWCLSLACSIPPSRLNVVLLDFKGGSGFNLLAGLPHTVGCVNDLDLEQAVRSLAGIRKELKRRETLVAREGVADVKELVSPPPRLLVVIDEFQALRQQLPDYQDDLVRLASQGRSLGMNLIACTQQTMGQVSAQMRANMNLGICLRVRDPVQSKELLGSACAAHISSTNPGQGFCEGGDGIRAFRTCQADNPGGLVAQIAKAASFCGFRPAPPLFSTPLPDTERNGVRGAGYGTRATFQNGHPLVPIGWLDDGVLLHTCMMPIIGNTALIGPMGRGKTTLIGALTQRLLRLLEEMGSKPGDLSKTACIPDSFDLRLSFRKGDAYSSLDLHTRRRQSVSSSDPSRLPSPSGSEPSLRNALSGQATSSAGASPSPEKSEEPYEGLIWLIDDAQDLLDPMSRQPLAGQVNKALSMDGVAVILAVDSAAAIRRPERFRQRLVFPFGERSVDMACGIPSASLDGPGRPVCTIPGRGLFMSPGQALPIQCFPSDSLGNNP
ncbi:FtsK/SpoIIIE domain-containing protein [Bifidobacterium coryneforme]|uniref:FtsK/SpoIIIE domain-containing protein n=1 Tax=Bifidobacterium coryneforme TaxID=1687 RepID=UPI0023F26541|nr:FtsK/SpoIIIE domain-containing protein [Bifidobacterium coryneforme]